MKRILQLGAGLALAATALLPALAQARADVGVSVHISQPGVSGRIDIGRVPAVPVYDVYPAYPVYRTYPAYPAYPSYPAYPVYRAPKPVVVVPPPVVVRPPVVVAPVYPVGAPYPVYRGYPVHPGGGWLKDGRRWVHPHDRHWRDDDRRGWRGRDDGYRGHGHRRDRDDD